MPEFCATKKHHAQKMSVANCQDENVVLWATIG